jgi:class 3 adenylate cyclase
MDQNRRTTIVLHAVEGLYALILLAWCALPFVDRVLGSFSLLELPARMAGLPPRDAAAFILLAALAAIVPLVALWKIASLALARRLPAACDPTRIVPAVLGFVASAAAIAAVLVHVVTYASSAQYFLAFPPVTAGVFLASLAFNALSIVVFILAVNRRDPSFREYSEYRRAAPEKPAAGGKRGARRSKGITAEWSAEQQGIQRRLVLAFVPLILVIIVVLALILMSDFSRTILASAIASGEALAERTASVAKANVGDRIAVEDYLAIEARKNEEKKTRTDAASALRFSELSYYQREARGVALSVIASTEPGAVGRKAPAGGAEIAATTHRYNAEARTFEFLSPVVLSGRTIGFVMADYARDVIYEPYFRTQVKVFVIAALFIYAAVFLIVVFGRAIVLPILFLRMSVKGISSTLSGMIGGKTKISADLLQYRDRVTTRDEIKALSREVGSMTTVIRGVIPYISASTLKHAERETPLSEKRDLTFLFTDIRGFTSLCEGQKPESIVTMLNHYLDIQSSVILANGGDIDKFVGDEIMAMFEGPRKELNACRASIEIRRAMAQEKEIAEAEERNVVSIGIGINTGPVVFGSVGAKDRMDFTSIGDTVNLAARLEGANKTYGTRTLVSEAVYDKVSEVFLCREIDLLTVKGKRQPVRIFEVLREKKGATPRLEQMRRIFEGGLAAYRKQRWDVAEKAFAALKSEFRDEASEVFLRRISVFRRNPPGPGWDGVFNLAVK